VFFVCRIIICNEDPQLNGIGTSAFAVASVRQYLHRRQQTQFEVEELERRRIALIPRGNVENKSPEPIMTDTSTKRGGYFVDKKLKPQT
jgi:hypothetical protein